MILLLFLSKICIAQINITYLNDVPVEFKKKYYSKKREYNPLQVGNLWQYYASDDNGYITTRVVQDSIINGKRYFKKIYYKISPRNYDLVCWERNDTVSGVTFMLDFEDVNKNGDYLEELPVDSLENPWWSCYITYKYSFTVPNPFSFYPGQKSTLVGDTNWVKLEGDTVISRTFQIGFWWEEIIESFGIFSFSIESPRTYCTGAIINGRKYGTIVSVEDDKNQSLPSEFYLGNNYPNPFNPTTTIRFSLPEVSFVTLKVYDVLGREITELINEVKPSGEYEVEFDGTGLSSGTYIYRLTAGKYSAVGKMALMK